ncbi:hypothetical protein [Marinobacter zhanjiangensis]|uniref:Uncharacterized protein n=1 Tax=Marinobacter zhanjiangensis TaxID=578215 RepID=A0ABQ3AR64_9GAMM|nr:hypothetical protein [Marinobacter zhanjiangensis]GGY62120.1 hypothetical protein GCM10007071_06240 [Marinobacter zhanjiangensis]
MKLMSNTFRNPVHGRNLVGGMVALVCGLGLSFHAMADQAMIREALSAAPPQVAETATVIDLEGNVIREGEGEYTCLPGPPGFAGPMCNDEQFMKWMQAMMNGEEEPPTTAVGTSYMLAGDSPDGGASNTDPAARTPTADNHWVVEGPHVMVIVPDAALLENLPTTPDTEGPYVMWPDSPYAHIMWPVAERPKQRKVSSK